MRHKGITLIFLMFFATTIMAQEFPRCIMAGDYPDPSIIREGRDFYMTHSMFEYNPGYLIWHSRDLINWDPVCRIATKHINDAWAPELLKHKDKYYLYFPSKKKVYVCIADHIEGPWTDPIEVKGTKGIDPGHIVDVKTGQRYLFVNHGRMAPLNDEGTALTDTLRTVHRGWDIPKNWIVESKWPGKALESPKLIYRNGYYYLTSAEGGTAGPPTSHMVVSARATRLEGPWEESPYNPIVHTYSDKDTWWSKGHGTLIDDADGNWWIVYHAYANSYHSLGRQTLIEPIEWTSDGWFRTKTSQPLPLIEQDATHGFTLSDDFSSDTLGLQWTFFKEYAPQTVKVGKGRLIMQGKNNSVGEARQLLITAEDKGYVVQVKVKNNATQSGLILFYNEKMYSGISTDGKWFYMYNKGELLKKVKCKTSKSCYIRLSNLGNKLTAQTSYNGKTWQTLCEELDLADMNHNKQRGFLALRPGLMVMGEGTGEFMDFRYKKQHLD
ncbi:MAG: family 43 glycosylhydrolase [Prevotella sp.]